MTTQFIENMAVEITGEGEPIVCLHGLGGSSNNWTPVEPALANFQLVRFDLPGSARSSGIGGDLSIESIADRIVQACGKLGINRAHFLGHSLGTIVCFHIAATQPRLVKSLALFGPLLCPPDAARPNIRARADKARNEGVKGMQEIADAIVAGAISATTRREQPAVSALVRESIMRQDAQGYARCCDALANAQAPSVDAIECPVLLVTGDQDGVAPPQAVRAIADRIPGSRSTVYAQCGHWTTFERAHDCMRDLKDFYSGRFQ
ncbi:alpha/beta fold hydrolase [Parapusillimonas sp. JC17]|uniref:alpha/beta fold hydrolase n=1 Tax=Parapusillimonas sp. JC17 TaxID=3445768 RepID=UPI003F9F381C